MPPAARAIECPTRRAAGGTKGTSGALRNWNATHSGSDIQSENYAAAFAGTGISQYSIRETTGKIIKKNAK